MMLRDDLIAARALIDTPEKWTKRRYYRSDGAARQYCAVGACTSALSINGYWAAEDALRDAIPAGFGGAGNTRPAVERYNDDPSTTHADIMALFDRAIQAATPEPENKS